MDEVIHIEADDVQWEVTEPTTDGDTATVPLEKHQFVQLLPITDDMQDGQKEFARLFNSMRDLLMQNGMMKKK